MEVNGIAHVMLTVSDFDACLPFYERVLDFLGLKPVLKMDGMLYCVGGRTAVGIVKAEDRWRDERFAQLRVGLHHSASAPASGPTGTPCTSSCSGSARRSSIRRRTARGRPATTRCCSRKQFWPADFLGFLPWRARAGRR